MSLLVWIMMAIALWHFTVFLPDHFWGGIVGAFLAAVAGSVLFGLIVSGFSIPDAQVPGLAEAVIAVPGSLIGLGASYLYGSRVEQA